MFVPALLVAAGILTHPVDRQDQAKVVFLKDARVVVKPGTVLDRASIAVRDGKIAEIGADIQAPTGADVVDCTGLTAYPGLIHPMVRVTVDGLSPAQAPAGGGGGGGQGRQNQTAAQQAEAMARRDKDPWGIEANLLSKYRTAELKQKDVSAFDTLLKSGYGLAQVSAGGGLVGPTSAIVKLVGKDLDPALVLSSPGNVPISMTARGFGSYPGSTMATIAFVRQALYDAQRQARLEKPEAQPALDNFVPVATGKALAVFDDLTEVSFFQAKKIVDEFHLKPVYGFRADAGGVVDLLKGSSVLLRGAVPAKPSVGENLASASINSVRDYFAEVQAGAELDKAGVAFVYAPSTMSEPLAGIRQYVRGGLDRNSALASMTTRPAEMLGVSDKAGTLESGKMANILLTQGDLFDSSSQIMAVYTAGTRADFKMPDLKKAEDLKTDAPLPVMAPKHELFPAPAETTQATRLYRNATIWTEGPQGVIKGGDILISGGKIVAVGRNLKAPAGCEVIDASGKHISPGIWDCHSHTAITGGVNEGSNMVTIECRIADVTNHKSPNIYNQLSGGTVGANQLHGSANVIGGQNNTVKWRWGLRPTEYRVEGAPEGVKFALGQNPIREDSSGQGAQPPVGTTLMTWRPRTRMGNEESIRRALQLGKEYNQAWEDYKAGKTKVEPRRDLQQEALGEVVTGKRLVHSHGYRADEMLALIRILGEYGGKLATLQHVLEGYKIADEMALQGVGGSTFADWWGYKLEAYDAIPYNAALMADRGVSVSVNSDSDNHARRLNQEAAKSMRYGGVSAEKALSFVTIEPCKQLGIADKTGSLEVGKDADMAVWTADPTSVYSVCLETYVDGVKRFDRAKDAKQREARDAELREAKKVLESDKASGNPFATDAGSANVSASIEGANVGKSIASFGIGPIKSEPGTMRYARRPVLITGVTVHPMEGNPFVGDVLLGSDGKIREVGQRVNGGDAEVVNGRGKHLYPGMIDPATTIGLNEIGQVPASDDSSERGTFHPDYRVERVINPEWETLGVARQQGVLTVLVKPSGSGVAGQAALVNTEGYTWEDLTVQGGVAMVCSSAGGNFDFGDETFNIMAALTGVHDVELDDCCQDQELMSGQNRQNQGGGDSPLAGLSKQLDQARAYLANVRKSSAENPVPRDQRQEAMALVARGDLPVMLSVTSATDIKNAVAWAEKEGVRVVLYGCSGAGEIAEWLAAKQVPICLGAVYRMPTGDQPMDTYYSLPSKLAKAGVKFCLTTENDKDVRQLRDQAGWAAAYGVEREEAARLVTLRAAEVLGLQDRLGAIKPGMDGTVILTDGELVETKTRVLRAWIESREVSLENKQTRLYDKYRTRPRQVRR